MVVEGNSRLNAAMMLCARTSDGTVFVLTSVGIRSNEEIIMVLLTPMSQAMCSGAVLPMTLSVNDYRVSSRAYYVNQVYIIKLRLEICIFHRVY